MRTFALIATAAIALAGCGEARHSAGVTPKPKPEPKAKRYPFVVNSPRVAVMNETSLPTRGPIAIAQLLSPTRLRIVTTGSSSCPSVPDELIVLSPHRVRLHLTAGSWDNGEPTAVPPLNGICTADLGTSGMVVTIDPTLVDVHSRLTVAFIYRDSKQSLVRIARALRR
ncbi:MAG: hypothetical protein QOG85_2593 [Gaiellaceae bacterium]|jgi:hypothetical protein|nr:hypothetical protein [Gaiellaceae bacterium]